MVKSTNIGHYLGRKLVLNTNIGVKIRTLIGLRQQSAFTIMTSDIFPLKVTWTR